MKRSSGGGEASASKRARSSPAPPSFFETNTPDGMFETVDPAWEFCKLMQCQAMHKIASLLFKNGKELAYSINADHRIKENLRVELLVRRAPGGIPESGLHYRVDKHYAGANVEEVVLTMSILPRNKPPKVHVDGWYRDTSLKYAEKRGDSVTVPSLIFYFGVLLADVVLKRRHPSVREDDVRLTLFASGGEALQRYYHDRFGFEWDNKKKDYESEVGAQMHMELLDAVERAMDSILAPDDDNPMHVALTAHPVHAALTALAAAVKPHEPLHALPAG